MSTTAVIDPFAKEIMHINLTAIEVSLVLNMLHDEMLHEKQQNEINPHALTKQYLTQMGNLEEKIMGLLEKDDK